MISMWLDTFSAFTKHSNFLGFLIYGVLYFSCHFQNYKKWKLRDKNVQLLYNIQIFKFVYGVFCKLDHKHSADSALFILKKSNV